jgi:hypothetical protein
MADCVTTYVKHTKQLGPSLPSLRFTGVQSECSLIEFTRPQRLCDKAISETTCFAAALAVLCARPLWEPLWLAALAKLVSTSMFMFFVIKASVMDFVKRSSVMSWEPVEALLFSGMEK